MKPLQDNHRESGFALPAALLLLLILSAIAVGMIYMVQTESRVSGSDLDSNRAYYAAEAGMEKMMADLSALFTARQAPTIEEIQGLSDSHPNLEGIDFAEYSFIVPEGEVAGTPNAETYEIQSGPNADLYATRTKMNLAVSSRGPAGSEVKLAREVNVVLIPVFQFGIFSSGDLSYFPGPNFEFGGRVHTNGNLFLSTEASSGLVFFNKVSAAGDVIRARLANGFNVIGSNRDKPVYIPRVPNGCVGSRPSSTCRDLQENEGSVTAGPGSSENPSWDGISKNTYNGMIVNGKTGATRLDLPFVAEGAHEIEIIRRAPLGEDPSSVLGRSRLYNIAQIRILLSDDPSDLPGGAGIELDNVPPYLDGTQHGATNTAFAEGETSNSDQVPPDGVSSGEEWTLIGGFLQVQADRGDGSWADVTSEWLDLGIARENEDAILRFQTIEDDDGNGSPDYTSSSWTLRRGYRFFPLALYDTREGEVRDHNLGNNNDSCAIGGIMSIIELDVDNLSRWLGGSIGLTGSQTDYVTQNGYILYFSDRRGMMNDDGEYGFEDNINPSSSSGLPNGNLDDAEDVNGSGTLEVTGADNLGDGFGVPNGDPTYRISCMDEGRKNRVTGARHALKLVNGDLGNLPTRPDGTGGFTVASENPVYIQGNYNAQSNWGNGSAAASVIADAVTLLSNSWDDLESFRDPTYPDDRNASETWYRVAIAGGKNKAFPRPTWGAPEDFGTDGGTHNFLRYLEDWGGDRLNYKGSLVSFYYATYAVGVYKCCSTVYSPPDRRYSFDTNFQDPALLPPGTPRFRDLLSKSYEQIFNLE